MSWTRAFAGAAIVALVVGGCAGARSPSSYEAQSPANPDSKERAIEVPGRMSPHSSLEQTQRPEPYSILDGEVTFGVARPWYGFFDYGPDTIALVHPERKGDFAVLPDPLPVETGCRQGPAPGDAEELARSIRSDPDLEATEPVAMSVGGIEALQMEVTSAPEASVCETYGQPQVLTADDHSWMGLGLGRGDRVRLYLLDLPGGSSAQILTIAFVASEARFETVLEEAGAILDSFEFHAP
jgi:hypothetical protein